MFALSIFERAKPEEREDLHSRMKKKTWAEKEVKSKDRDSPIMTYPDI